MWLFKENWANSETLKIIEFLDIVSQPVFSFKHNVSETGVCPHPQVKAYSLGPEDGETVHSPKHCILNKKTRRCIMSKNS
jgi:hypothetical protein